MKKEFIRFLIVGIANTIIGMAAILLLYNLFHLGYWLASGAGYILGSVVSFFLNKSFTFQYKEKNLPAAVRFFINAVLCYFIAYVLAKPLTFRICNRFFLYLSVEDQEELALLLGMAIYTILNFTGQKFFCFRLRGNQNDS